MAKRPKRDEPDIPSDPDIPGDHEDQDLNPLREHATRTELMTFLPLAMRFLEADGDDDRNDYPPGELLVEGILVAAAAGYIVGGSGDKVFSAGMSFVLSDRHRHVVKAWKLLADMTGEEVDRRVEAARVRAMERAAKEAEKEGEKEGEAEKEGKAEKGERDDRDDRDGRDDRGDREQRDRQA